MAKAGVIASGVSSVVGVFASSHIAASLLTAMEVTTISAGTATALSLAVPVVGAMIGIALSDVFFGKGEEKRSIANYLATAVCSIVGWSFGSTLLGGGAFAATAGSLATEEAVKQTVESGVLAPSLEKLMAITSVGSLAGGFLGSMVGAATANLFTGSKQGK